jgi:hypothetical protein
MAPDVFLSSVIEPGLAFISGLIPPPPTDDARRFLLAIALQESGPALEARYQNSPAATPGPARGWWQFEQGGGVAGVLQHPATRHAAAGACSQIVVVPQPAAVWRAIEGNDLLACCFARLLIWTDPAILPTTESDGWGQYMRLWRPGKPHPATWGPNWLIASKTVTPIA